MPNTRLGRCVNGGKSDPPIGYVETDPSGRYGRFREVLGKGAMKVVYRGFDEVLGMEVAWNQIKINEVFRSPEEIQRLYSEVHILKNLHHDSIIKYHASWIDINRRNFNFITEMFTSGTLREYRQKYPRVDIRAVKNWARQILHGLSYLHGLEPPVIHRDLKCDNIFVNGHLGQVKIGDLGLAAILRRSHHAHSVIGTPEFMAPELYEEEYDELVDIYSFGMCFLEMLTSEYPYSECSNPAQIYKKVTSGKLPEALHRIKDLEARRFVENCLANVSKRLPARELLIDPFLACEDEIDNNLSHNSKLSQKQKSLISCGYEDEKAPELNRTTNMLITGTMNPEDDDTIFLKVQISDIDGNTVKNIHFPFDIINDTAIDVATEMVKELEISDLEPFEIAEMIEEQLSSLVPNWKGTHDWTSTRLVQQELNLLRQSFIRQVDEEEDDDNDEVDFRSGQPFYASSCSTSHNSLLALNNSSNFPRGNGSNSIDSNWLKDHEQLMNDDTSSVSSFNSFNYSNINYYSAPDLDLDLNAAAAAPGGAHKSTRFRPPLPPGNPSEPYNNIGSEFYEYQRLARLPRIQSMVDVRSQLLHRKLVEELINKSRIFNTVGAVEGIGFQDLAEPF